MTDERPTSPWRHPRRWLPLLILAFILVSFIAYRLISDAGVKKVIQQKRAQGIPMSPLELDIWYKRVPASENAGLAFESAFQTYVAPGKPDPNEMSPHEMVLGEPLPHELAQAVATHLAANRATIEEIHAAAQLSASRYSIDLSRGFATLLPHLARLRSLAQLMRWEAIQQSARGDRVEALRALKSGAAIAASLEKEPLLISYMVRIAILNVWLRALEHIVTKHTLTDAELSELTDLLVRAEQAGREVLHRAIVGERAIGVAAFDLDYKTFESISAGGTSPDAELPDFLRIGLYEFRRAAGMNNRDLAFYLDRLNELENAVTNDHSGILQKAQAVTDTIEQELPKHRLRYLISGMILPSISKAMEKEAFIAAELRCARAALAIERFRLKKSGRLPSPHELVPAFLPAWPLDPFTNDPLEYEKLPVGYQIVSAEGTALREKENTKKSTAVSFRVLR